MNLISAVIEMERFILVQPHTINVECMNTFIPLVTMHRYCISSFRPAILMIMEFAE